MLKPLEPIKRKDKIDFMEDDEWIIQNKFESLISLDPGVKSLLTGYSIDGTCVEFGKDGMDVLFRHLYRADKIQSKMNEKKSDDVTFVYNNKKRKRLRHIMLKLFCKVRNKVKDCHHKISKYLCENYDAVLLPIFNTQDMARRENRRLRNKTVRQMCTWSHYRFRQIIEAKAKRYDCLIAPCDEYYASKTCSNCGNINHKLRCDAEREYRCKECCQVFDRDINAAKNILMKFVCKYD